MAAVYLALLVSGGHGPAVAREDRPDRIGSASSTEFAESQATTGFAE